MGDGSSAPSSQLSRVDLRWRIAHNQVDDSSQPVSDHTDEVSVESKDYGASNSSTVCECGARSEIKNNHGADKLQKTHLTAHSCI